MNIKWDCYSRFFCNLGINYIEKYGESKQVFIRKLIKEDYHIYREVIYAHFFYKNVFTEKFMQGIWKEVNAANGLGYAIMEKGTGETCGFCLLKNIGTLTHEIGIDIRDVYMGKGYAQEAVKLLISYVSQTYDMDYFI